jgi:hypothetical protein
MILIVIKAYLIKLGKKKNSQKYKNDFLDYLKN